MANERLPDNVRIVNIILVVFIVGVLMGCKSEIISTKPKASFEYYPSKDIKTGDAISFTNNSKNADSYHWDFGDSCVSNDKEPTHYYNKKRIYLVKLYASKQTVTDENVEVETDSLTKNLNVSIGVPIPCFEYKRTSIHTVDFTNCSIRVTDYLWDFGDGTTSTEKSPIHTYNSFGTFKVILTISNDGITDTISKMIDVTDVVNLANLVFVDMNPKEDYRYGAYLDVDLDGVNDFWISFYDHFGTTSEYYSRIGPRSDYELFVDSALAIREDCGDIRNHKFDTTKVEIPKVFVFGSEISNSCQTSMSDHYIARLTLISRIYDYNIFWIKDEIRYIGFRKRVDSKTMLGWIKLKVTGYNNFKFYSCKIPSEGERLIIDR